MCAWGAVPCAMWAGWHWLAWAECHLSPCCPPLDSLPLPLQTSFAQQLCRQYIIAGQHLLDDTRPTNTYRWWTLAGQEVTISLNRLVRGDKVPGGENSPGGGKGMEMGGCSTG